MMRLFTLLLVTGICVPLGADPPESIPTSDVPGFRLKALPMAKNNRRPDVRAPFTDAQALEHLRKRGDNGFANGLIEPGARELQMFRYYDQLGRLTTAEGWGWANRAVSQYLDGLILGKVVDLIVLGQCDYGTEAHIRVDEVLREPTFPIEEQTVRVRLVNGRKTDKGRITKLNSEPQLKIGDQLLIGLSTVPANMWEMQINRPCSDQLDLLYRTEILAEEGFYEMRNILMEPVILNNQVQFGPTPSMKRSLEEFLVDLRDVTANPENRLLYPNEPPHSHRDIPPAKDRSRRKGNSQ